MTLALAYIPGAALPRTRDTVPLEYFADALRWLREHPDSSGEAPMVWGFSRGGEVSLLLAATFPELVSGVVAGVPADRVHCGPPSWTLRETTLPCFGSGAHRTSATLIPVDRVQDPVLLVCGEADAIWDSCGMSRRVVARLERDTSPPHRFEAYPDAGHLVALPPVIEVSHFEGEDPVATERARVDMWRITLQFLADVDASAG